MLKTNIRKFDIFKLYYWHGATLVGKYKLPQLAPTQAIPAKVISFNERKGINNPKNYWVDFFIDDAEFEYNGTTYVLQPETNNNKTFLVI